MDKDKTAEVEEEDETSSNEDELSTFRSHFRPYAPGTVYYDPWLDDITYREKD